TGVVKLEAEQFKNKIDSAKNFQLVDVRTPEEFKDAHLKHAFNNNVMDSTFSKKSESLDKNKPVFIYCKGGSRSANAAQILNKAGFKTIYDLNGGIMAWNNKNLPVEKKSSVVLPDKISDADFNSLKTGKIPVLIDYYAEWCIPCKKMEPVLEKLAKEFEGKIIIKRINVDESPALCKKMNVASIPVVSAWKNGAETKNVSGFQSEETLRAIIAELLKQ
ncbi:MAG: thioredoxin, partial [Bacteroidia bacterium]|nr:thioredoxin [Bacteroidia bacterium]